MNCLECSLSPTIDVPLTAIGDCAYCGAGVCLDHARVVSLDSQPIGVVPEIRHGERRILCTTCYAGADLEGQRAGAFTSAAPKVSTSRGKATASTARAGR